MTAPARESARERIARELQRAMVGEDCQWERTYDERRAHYRNGADYILAERDKRERPLVEAVEAALGYLAERRSGEAESTLRHYLARYRALDAPAPRSLAEVAADIVARRTVCAGNVIDRELMDELAAALAREKEGR